MACSYQTRDNPNYEWEMRTWNALLVISTLFPASDTSKPYIISHFANHISDENSAIANIAQLCIIRFSFRCYMKKPREDINKLKAEQILVQYERGVCEFMAPLYEHLWFQRNTHPHLKVPAILNEMAHYILSMVTKKKVKNPFKEESLTDSDMKTFITGYNNRYLNLNYFNILALCTIFKKWFKENGYHIFTQDLPNHLVYAEKRNRYNEFVDLFLNKMNKNLLGFLIGFLHEMSKYVHQTHMDEESYAIAFAPSISYNYLHIDCTTRLLRYLIKNWDASSFFNGNQ